MVSTLSASEPRTVPSCHRVIKPTGGHASCAILPSGTSGPVNLSILTLPDMSQIRDLHRPKPRGAESQASGTRHVTAPAAALVRPDGYVAWVGDKADRGLAGALTNLVRTACGGVVQGLPDGVSRTETVHRPELAVGLFPPRLAGRANGPPFVCRLAPREFSEWQGPC